MYDLGLGDRVVGLTKFCVRPEDWFRNKPRVGGTKKVAIEKVRALKPDLIIGNKEENERKDIHVLEQEFPVWMSDVRDLEGALDMVLRVGELTGTTARAESITDGIRQAFVGLRPLEEPRTVAYFIWRDSFMVAGGDTFISDLMERAGFSNAFAHRKKRHAEITSAELLAADPDVILLSSEPVPFAERHIAEFNRMRTVTPVHLVDGELFSWYGSRLLQAPAYFASLRLS